MPEQKHLLYFMGSMNGDIRLFRRVWYFIQEYLSEGPATIFVCGNFGLKNAQFLDQISKEIQNQVSIHVAGGNEAKEGWSKNPPPKQGYTEIRPGIFLHAFGSCIRMGHQHILFIGQGEAIPEDFLPTVQTPSWDVRPDTNNLLFATECLERYNPEIIVSHAFPSRPLGHFVQSLPPDDLRRTRTHDAILPYLDTLFATYVRQPARKRWWFAGNVNVAGTFRLPQGIHFVSLCSLVMVRASMASLERRGPHLSNPDTVTLGNFAYA